jgi:ubiquinone/menaquinone biosynthesis C-methylase UbiE
MTLAADLGFSPVGTDVSENGLRHAHQRLAGYHARPAVVASGMTDLPFADNTFSVVLSYGVFYYGTADEMRTAIHEARRVMCPGGRILVIVRSTRDYRFGKGEQLERNTYRLKISDTNEFGTTLHFLTAADIPEYFGDFAQVSFESSELTFGNRSRLDSDWIITAEK